MIILPERGLVRTKFLQPIPERDWRTPSQAQPKNCFGHESQTRFTVTARDRSHGRVLWQGWFDDFEDFDTFCWAHVTENIRYDRFIQKLPDTEGRFGDFHPGMLEEGWWWEHHQWHFLVGPQYPTTTSWSVPSNCAGVSGKSGEFIDCIGAGGSGSSTGQGNAAQGGGGGAFSRVVSLALTPGSSVNTNIGAGGTATSAGSGASATGVAGGNTWFNGTTVGGASVSAYGGLAASWGNSFTNDNGGPTSGNGTTKYKGGKGGDGGAGSSYVGTGGGGAGGPNGAGNNGTAIGVNNSGTAGGSADAGSGGSGGAAGTGGAATAGGSGTEYDGTHGCGGGGGGRYQIFGAAPGAAAGSYGGGSGAGASFGNTGSSPVGGAGLIVIKFEPPKGNPIFRRQTRFFTRRF